MLRKILSLLSILWVMLICGCATDPNPERNIEDLGPFTWKLLDSTRFEISDLQKAKATVIITLMPDCPMCANYSKVINSIVPKFAADSVAFYGLFPTEYYSLAEIRSYRIKYGMTIPFILDPENSLASFLGAEVTPEAFVLGADGELIYQGLLDDWAIDLGKKKKKAEHHYLTEALNAFTSGNDPDPKYTKAVGCIIEYDQE